MTQHLFNYQSAASVIYTAEIGHSHAQYNDAVQIQLPALKHTLKGGDRPCHKTKRPENCPAGWGKSHPSKSPNNGTANKNCLPGSAAKGHCLEIIICRGKQMGHAKMLSNSQPGIEKIGHQGDETEK
jgi:hypothetical protein